MTTSNKFAIAFLALDNTGTCFMPGGGPVRIHEYIDLVKDPSTMSMLDLQELIKEWGQERWHTLDTNVNFVTPMEPTDWSRTVRDWSNHPTQFQIDQLVDRENKLFQSERESYGKLAVNFLIGM